MIEPEPHRHHVYFFLFCPHWSVLVARFCFSLCLSSCSYRKQFFHFANCLRKCFQNVPLSPPTLSLFYQSNNVIHHLVRYVLLYFKWVPAIRSDFMSGNADCSVILTANDSHVGQNIHFLIISTALLA